MDARENTMHMFQVVVVVADPAVRLGHAELGIATRHPFDTHEPHTVAVQIKRAIFDFELAYTECSGEGMSFMAAANEELQTIEMRMVEVPEPCPGKLCGNRQRLDGGRLNRQVSRIRIAQDFASGFLVHYTKRCPSLPRFCARIAALGANGGVCVPTAAIGTSLAMQWLQQRPRRDQQAAGTRA